MMKSLLLSVFLSAGLSYQQPGETNTGYECQYLSSHKELSCQCSRHTMNIANLAELISSTPSPVESLKLEYCQSVDLRLDMVRVTQPFYQVRVEAADQVRQPGQQEDGAGGEQDPPVVSHPSEDQIKTVENFVIGCYLMQIGNQAKLDRPSPLI